MISMADQLVASPDYTNRQGMLALLGRMGVTNEMWVATNGSTSSFIDNKNHPKSQRPTEMR